MLVGEMQVFINAEINAFRTIADPKARKAFLKSELLKRYKESLDEAKLERYLERHASGLLLGGVTPFMRFYAEAHTLYNEGYFYSCVCVCGITAERVEAEIVRRAKSQIGAEEYGKQRQQWENESHKGTANFLTHLGLITRSVADVLIRLWHKRTDYVHPSGPLQPADDAKSCIEDLAFVINELADAFKFFDIRDGVLVPKPHGIG